MRYKTSNTEIRKAKEECGGRYKMLFIKHNFRAKTYFRDNTFRQKVLFANNNKG